LRRLSTNRREITIAIIKVCDDWIYLVFARDSE
jgi:hypothetical protein